MVRLLHLCVWLLLAGPLWAQTSPDTSHPRASRVRFATVLHTSGALTASYGETNVQRVLHPGDEVFVGDRLQAAAHADAVLKTEDAAYVALRAGSDFLVDQYQAEGRDSDRFTLRLLQGGLRLISGWVAKLQPQSYRILTPTASVGIRGTDHETYVLTEEMAEGLTQPAGTYDKVNSGGTFLETGAGRLDISPGKVGFARLSQPRKTRALITLSLPVLLERMPGFFVPGAFDAELDALAAAPAANQPATAARPADRGETRAVSSAAAGERLAGVPTPLLSNGPCNAQDVAARWLEGLDAAIARNEAPAVLALFAQDAEVSVTVLDAKGQATTARMDRVEFAASSLAALNSLSGYSQSRLTVRAHSSGPGQCDAVFVQSSVLEQGSQNGKPYRFVTLETYELVWRAGNWLALKAQTRQE